jgi:hypothetical protein
MKFILPFLALTIMLSPLCGQTLHNPESIAIDSYYPYTKYISNAGNGQILSTTNLTTYTVFAEGLGSVRGLCIKDRVLYAATAQGLAIYSLNTLQLLALVPVPGSVFLNDVVADDSGNIYISDSQAHTIFRYNIATSSVTPFVTSDIQSPNGMVFDSKHNRILLVSYRENSPLQSILLSGGEVKTLLPTNLGYLDGIGIDTNGAIYFSSWQTNTIYRIMSLTARPYPVYRNLDGPADFAFYSTRSSSYSGWTTYQNKIYIPNFNSNSIAVNELPNLLDNFETNMNTGGYGDPGDYTISWITNKEVNLLEYNLYYDQTDYWHPDFTQAVLSTYSHIPAQNVPEAYYASPIEMYWYCTFVWLEMVEQDGSRHLFGPNMIMIVDNQDGVNAPALKNLLVYPNPITSKSVVSFELDRATSVKLSLTDVKGRMIFRKELGVLNKGKHIAELCPPELLSHLSNGIYCCRLKAGDKTSSRRITLLR